MEQTPSTRACLLLHGFTGDPAEMEPFAKALVSCGYDTMVPALPGHGGDPSRLILCTHQDWIRAAETFAGHLAERHGVFDLVGFSMGGLLAAYIANRYPVRRLALLNAAAIYISPMRLAGHLAEMARRMDFSPLRRAKRVPLKAALEFVRLSARLRSEFRRLSVPTLIVQSTMDHVVHPASARLLFRQIRSQRQIMYVPGVRHLLNEEPAAGEVAKALKHFFVQGRFPEPDPDRIPAYDTDSPPAAGDARPAASGAGHADPRLDRIVQFVLETDKLKDIYRQTYITGMSRRENSAEHSWHLALMAVMLKDYANEPVDLLKTIQMLLVHDIVEIDAGDTFAYDEAGHADKEERETAAARRLFGMLPPDLAERFHSLWREFEERKTPEARFAAALDRLHPMILNRATEGAAWKKNGVRKEQVLRRNAIIEDGSGALWEYARRLVDDAVNKGLLDE
jgi:putative hydrolase of HD superfamily